LAAGIHPFELNYLRGPSLLRFFAVNLIQELRASGEGMSWGSGRGGLSGQGTEAAEKPADALAAETHKIHQEKKDQIGIAPGNVRGQGAAEPFG
jgi:hypothetical protein